MRMIKLTCILCLLAACSKQHEGTVAPATEITIITDLTDTLAVYPQAEPILALYGFNNNADQGATFRQVLLTDKKLNPTEDISLETRKVSDSHNTNDDVEYREQIVYAFQDAVRKALEDFPKRYAIHPLGHSECFATISSELNRLAASTASQRILIVYSDLMENEEDISVYSDANQQLLHKNPAKVAKILSRRCPLPEKLVGVTVYFVFNPPDRNSDTKYGNMVSLYERLLKARGARVVIQASNKRYEP